MRQGLAWYRMGAAHDLSGNLLGNVVLPSPTCRRNATLVKTCEIFFVEVSCGRACSIPKRGHLARNGTRSRRGKWQEVVLRKDDSCRAEGCPSGRCHNARNLCPCIIRSKGISGGIARAPLRGRRVRLHPVLDAPCKKY